VIHWTHTFAWRNSTIRLVSGCGPLDVDGVIAELEIGYERATADILHSYGPRLVVWLPPLGTPDDPYIIHAMVDPKCPGGALACSGAAPPSRSTWIRMRTTCGPKVLAAIDHEIMHRWSYLLTGSTKLGALADHPAGKGYRYNVFGQKVPIPPKVEPKPPEPEPEPAVKLNERQAAILAGLPDGWFTPSGVGVEVNVIKRMVRKGALERKGKLYRRKP
jgi:hypothetical protein